MSLPLIEPSPSARIGKSPPVILREGAALFRRFGRPPAEVTELETMAAVAERSTPGHFRAYAKLCLENTALECERERQANRA